MSILTNRLMGLIFLTIFGLISGCASLNPPKTRYISKQTIPEPINVEGRRDGVIILLKYDIKPNGPGSWVTDAKWREFLIQVRNQGRQDICINSWKVLNTHGVYVSPLNITHYNLMTDQRRIQKST